MKKYIFYRSTGRGYTDRIEKLESELTKEDKDLMYGNLIDIWNSQTEENQYKFLDEMFKESKKKMEKKLFDELNSEFKDNNI